MNTQDVRYDFISDDDQYKLRYDQVNKKYRAIDSKGKTASWKKEDFEDQISNVHGVNKRLSESLITVIKTKLK